jgi:membrane-bound metal-dependent hydrolase YbcI (DUF457 family)
MHPDWKQFRQRVLLYFLVCYPISFAPWLAALVGIFWLFFYSDLPAEMLAVLVMVFAIISALVWLTLARCDPVYDFRCPRCKERFFLPKLSGVLGLFLFRLPCHLEVHVYALFARRCWHCGLPKWADPGELSSPTAGSA